MRYLFLFLLLALSYQAAYAEPHDTLLKDIEGDEYSLNDYIGKGKWVILNVWGTDCPYCRDELDTLIKFHEKNHKDHAIIIGLTLHWPTMNFPDQEALYYFALEYSINYPLLMVDGDLASTLIGKPVNMIPLTFFYNPKGELVYRLNGVVTTDLLEEIIELNSEDYKEEWAEVVPPIFQPK